MGTPVEIKVLGDGRVRIHLFVMSDKGPVHTGSTVAVTQRGPLKLGGAVGYVACQPARQNLTSPLVHGYVQPLPISAEVIAVTCPECAATKEYGALADELEKELGARTEKKWKDPRRQAHAVSKV